MITIIVAIAENRAIGIDNNLLYHIPADMKRFRNLTTGNTVLMGRKTFQSLPKGALPDRRNIVLTRSESALFPGAETFPSLEAALEACGPDEHVYIIGGAQVYRKALPLADTLEVTLVHDTPLMADSFFPEFEDGTWKIASRQDFEPDSRCPWAYSFITYIRH